jgi:predicted small secreted protein
MHLRRSKSAALVGAVAALAAAVLAGCGSNTRENHAGREGLPEKVGQIEYNVYITRELNLRDVEDSGYYKGAEAPPGFALYGVFLTACNPGDSGSNPGIPAASEFAIVDTLGNRFKPLPLPLTNDFAYHARPLKHKTCIPKAGSLASSLPTNGSLLIFKLPLTTLENRPLDLEIVAPPDVSGTAKTGKIELDV